MSSATRASPVRLRTAVATLPGFGGVAVAYLLAWPLTPEA